MTADRTPLPTSGRFAAPQDREIPTTSRGRRTREALVKGARTVFARDGFLDSRLVDIATEAGIAVGSFYTYFASKEEVLLAVLENVNEGMLHPVMEAASVEHASLADRIRASHRAFLHGYRENADLMRLLEQASAIDPEFAQWRLARDTAFVEVNARWITRLQEQGLADAELDPWLTAGAFSAMIGRLAYSCYVLGLRRDDEDMVETCVRIWMRTLRLEDAEAQR
ncbi:TetR/AcrR family transcriptional regulator [Aeromicrobium piscarium]|uniref:TetR/AcrR family transcriptional regulator n=1 Tax=Aeromicrobium piscarium TaxID=2590901 RepID=A0A554SQ37_9ACTN|nr:TetR/AcrR family transcriptional regulator [Aeromicrobium piscarium]TSD68462.1 TetR/AcrR family transcriptional regulator [Aeromicrobium piscarium]